MSIYSLQFLQCCSVNAVICEVCNSPIIALLTLCAGAPYPAVLMLRVSDVSPHSSHLFFHDSLLEGNFSLENVYKYVFLYY
jgi:hypothetical protein